MLPIPSFHVFALAAAQYWARSLDKRVTRPVGLRDALLAGITSSQHPRPTSVVLCSRPEQFPMPDFDGVNVLAIVAYDLGLHLNDFESALTILHPDWAPELLLHPQGRRRPLMPEYPLNVAPGAPLPPGEMRWDPITHSIVVPLNPDYPYIEDYEILFPGPYLGAN